MPSILSADFANLQTAIEVRAELRTRYTST